MRCQACGAESGGGARFCASCGSPLASSAWEGEREAALRRQEVADRMGLLCEQFEGQRADYDRMRRLDEAVADCKEKNGRTRLLKLSLVWAFLIIAALASTAGKGKGADTPIEIAPIAIFALVPLAAVLLGKAARAALAKRYSEASARAYERVEGHYRSVADNPLAFEYSDPYSLEALRQIVRAGKADTVKEAVNVLEQSKYRSSMLGFQGRILEEAQEIKKAAAAAAAFAGVAAFRPR